MGLYENSNGNLNLLAGGTLYASAPTGSIFPFGGSTAPTGFLICDGQAISRTYYADLFAVIGTSFGSGNGTTTFNIPDLRGEFLRGAGTNSHNGQGNGGSVGTHQDATNIPRYQAHFDTANNRAYYVVNTDASKAVFDISNQDTEPKDSSYYADQIPASGGTLTNRSRSYGTYTARPTNTSVNYIIKATTIALPSDFEAAVDEKINEVVTPTLTSFTNITRTLANGQTYLNENMFAVPEGTKRVFFALEGSGNIGGYVELIKGIQGYARDFNNIGEALVGWTNANNINVSYFYNHVGIAKEYTFKCKYLA